MAIKMEREGPMENNANGEPERRNFFRLVYESDDTAVLKVDQNKFEIADISEGGIRFFNKDKYPFPQQVQGTVLFINGNSLVINGVLEWEEDNLVGLSLKPYVPAAIIEKEKKYLILHND
jgi:hypothetical protein